MTKPKIHEITEFNFPSKEKFLKRKRSTTGENILGTLKVLGIYLLIVVVIWLLVDILRGRISSAHAYQEHLSATCEDMIRELSL